MEDYTKKPEGYEEYLSDYGEQLYDGYSEKPVGWGFEVIKKMPLNQYEKLKTLGEMAYPPNKRVLITKKLSREDAIKQYGNITNEEIGPRNGWKSITFGETKFLSNYLKG